MTVIELVFMSIMEKNERTYRINIHIYNAKKLNP